MARSKHPSIIFKRSGSTPGNRPTPGTAYGNLSFSPDECFLDRFHYSLNSMFTCKKIRNGSTYLDTHLSANDYYCEQEQVSGIWIGKGAERLGIADQPIEKEDAAFEALRVNQHPDGSGKLTPRNVDSSIRFFDFQCSAQKSVSIMAVMMEDRRLYEAHDRASRAALAELERFRGHPDGSGTPQAS